MAVEIKWLGHASFRIASGASVVYIDPWKLENATADATVVIVSHSHYDHCSPQDVAKVSTAATKVWAPADTVDQLPGAAVLAPGQTAEAGGIGVQGIPAYNQTKPFHPRANNWLGLVISLDGKRVYYAGDTDLVQEMSSLANIDVALLPVGGTYTMDANDAALAAQKIGCVRALPYHWGDIVGSEQDASAFAEAAGCEVQILQPGALMYI